MEFQYSDSSRPNRHDNHTSNSSSINNTFPLQSNHNNPYQYQFDHFNQASVDPVNTASSPSSSSLLLSSPSITNSTVPRTSYIQPIQNISSLPNPYNYSVSNSTVNCNFSNPTPNNILNTSHHHHLQQQQQQQQQQQEQSYQQQQPQQQQQHLQHRMPQHQHHPTQRYYQQQQQEEEDGLNFSSTSSSSSLNRHNYTNQTVMNKSRQSREQQKSPVPQYRIFKRGDNITGIPAPQLNNLPPINSIQQNNEILNGTNSSHSNNIQQLQQQQQQKLHQQQQQQLQQHLQQKLQQQLQQQSQEIISCEPGVGNVNTVNMNNINSSIDEGSTTTCNNATNTPTSLDPTIATSNNAKECDANSVNSPTSNSDQNNKQHNNEKGSNNRTPISIVGDIARFHGITAEYRLTNETGPPHAPVFTIVLSLGSEQYQAQGNSIKKAQLAAAAMAVEKTTLSRPQARPQPRRNHNAGGFHSKRTNWTLMQLNALAEELNEKLSFTSQPVPIMNPFGRTDPPSLVVVHVGEKVFTGEGPNFNAAKNQAALSALKALLQIKQEREIAKLAENGISLPDVEADTEGKSPISVCHEMALKRGLTIAFDVKDESGPPHLKVFTVECIVGELTTVGNGPTKQQAKKTSCEAMIQKLKEVPVKLPKVTSIKSIQKGLLRPKVSRKKPSTPVVKEVDKQVVSPISRLLQIAHVKKFKEPEFSLVEKPTNEEQPDQNTGGKGGNRNSRKKKPLFTIEVKIGPHICTGTGSNKKCAKKAAANAALQLLGYAPTESKPNSASNHGNVNDSDTTNKTNGTTSIGGNEVAESTNHKNSSVRQLVPGVLVIKSETNSQNNSSPTNMAQEMIKLNSMSIPNTTSKTAVDGTGKLSYLADLLQVSVSYSDFPKKNEFLSVVSISTNPPHVAHGIGATREEAQNSAALEILQELQNSGLENVST